MRCFGATADFSIVAGILSGVLWCSAGTAASDDLIAHELYRAGRFAEAAELFTDPHWKGVALYRSDQWWRAAEAFVRTDSADGLYNLGNTYVRLGYHALALEAYIAALGKAPDHADAAHNADIIRALLASDNEEAATGRSSRQRDVLETLESQSEPQPGGTADQTEQDSQRLSTSDDAESRNPGDAPAGSRSPTPGRNSQQERPQNRSPDTGADETGGTENGRSTDLADEQTAAAGGDSGSRTPASQAAARRESLNNEQSVEQWLNQIRQHPLKYLKAGIAAEIAHRKSLGVAVPDGGDLW